LKNLNFVTELNEFTELIKSVKDKKTPVYLTGLSNIHKADMVLNMYHQIEGTFLILCSDDSAAYKLMTDVNDLAQEHIAQQFISRDFSFFHIEGMGKEYEQQRISTLSSIISGDCSLIVTSVSAFLQRTIPKQYMMDNTVSIKMGDDYDIKELIQKLTLAGYVRRDNVDGNHQFSHRGFILDIFISGYKKPVRLEFWDNIVDSISHFNIETQRREEAVKSITITPSIEVLVGDVDGFIDKLNNLKENLNADKSIKLINEIDKDINKLESGLTLPSYDKYINFCYEEFNSIMDYFDEPTLVISEQFDIFSSLKTHNDMNGEEIVDLLGENVLCKEMVGFYRDNSYVEKSCSKYNTVIMDTFLRTSKLPIKKILDFSGTTISPSVGTLLSLKDDILGYLYNQYAIVLFGGNEKSSKLITKDLQNENINAVYTQCIKEIEPNIVYVTDGSISNGYTYNGLKYCIMTVSKHKNTKSKKSTKAKNNNSLTSLDDIKGGDLLVHSAHGIGRFCGINNMVVSGVKKDYIKIQYRGKDTLYLPVTQLDLVSKYIGPRDDERVKLNKLHSVEWNKTKQKVYNSVKDMAKELIQIYSKRSKIKGFNFSEDNEWQKQFEEHFPFTETDDQLKCVKEIKEDMQSTHPMDRLLCGDVGFGKTEVAIRAAFKAVMDGKQCSILVPTTILAWQHYQNILKRMEQFPVKVELLSRFRTPKQQKEIIKKLSTGEIDIIVGTHRIVQRDIIFKDLGLAIIDEEQRFGVTHKEKFKEMFCGVDVLTLSATPIPRTLNMAMSGIRDMSLIEEAPIDRKPVQTYVMEHNDDVIIEAIKREKRRGGQVYYVHNNTETISLVAGRIRNSIEDIRVVVAHGKMNEQQLSKIWSDLINGEIDVLVCTTIIETGVDVANCNTLIVENSDNMGLSQLYQLRGRVGRSTRRGFCYLTFRTGKVLTEIATKRLSAIREFTNFGSGFKIALRDLEIRGAGNILGGSQHGHMDSVGYDMYIKLLNNAILEERGEKGEVLDKECLIDIPVDAFIPDYYIIDIATRIDIYKKIATVKSKSSEMDIIDELIDRFGEPPKCVYGLIDIALIRNTAINMNISEILQKSGNIFFYSNNFDINYISLFIRQYNGGRVLFNASTKPYISVKVDNGKKSLDILKDVIKVFSDIVCDSEKDNKK